MPNTLGKQQLIEKLHWILLDHMEGIEYSYSLAINYFNNYDIDTDEKSLKCSKFGQLN
jgi:hypothetical protein